MPKPMPIHFVLTLSLLDGNSLPAARIVLMLFALELGAEPWTAGLLFATFSVGPMLFSVPAGRLADRFGARWLLIFAAAGGAFGMSLPFFLPGLPAIFAAAAMMGLSEGIYSVLLQNLVGLLSTPDNRARNFSNFVLTRSVGTFVGPLIAGFSIDFSGHATACLYLVALTLVPVVMLALRRGALRGGARQVTHAGGGLRAMLSDPIVRRVLAISSLLHVGRDLYQFYMPVYTHSIGLSASVIGIVLAANATAVFIARLILPGLIARFTEEKLLACIFYAGAASLMLIPFFQDAVMLALISFIFGLSTGCGGPIMLMLMFSSSAEGRSGETLGLRMTVNHFTKIAGPVVFGSIASAFGLFVMFWINALMMGTGGILSRPKKTR